MTQSEKALNIFVIAHLGQLRQSETLIKRKNIRDCKLLILFTGANLIMPSVIEELADRDLFAGIEFIELPKSPDKINYHTARAIEHSYKDFLDRHGDIKEIFFSSFSGHYAIFLRLCEEKDVKKSLIEEGTGTYKPVTETDALQNFSFMKSAKESFKNSLGKNKLILFIYEFFILLPYDYYLFWRKLYFSEYVQSKLIARSKSATNALLTRHKKFNKLYAAFPNAIKEAFECNEIEEFCAYTEPTHTFEETEAAISLERDITEKDFIYASQRYPVPDHITAAILADCFERLLRRNPESVIFIKFHPKEQEPIREAYFSEIEKRQIGRRVFVVNDNTIPVETIIYHKKPKKLLAMTSSSLVYAPKAFKDIECVSLADYVIAACERRRLPEKNYAVIREHARILTLFPHVKKFEAESACI